MVKLNRIVLLALLLLALGTTLMAQDMMAPAVKVSDQASLNGMVVIDEVYSEGPGFIVIHQSNGGNVGPGIGFRWVNQGTSKNVQISIDATMATSELFAMLHVDDNEVGVYEFGTVDGADAPVPNPDTNPAFKVEVLRAYDQMVKDNMVMIKSVTTAADGFVVIHQGDATSFGPVIGTAAVKAGTTTDLMVPVEGEITEFLWPMLHVDTGAVGTYEFGTVEGADGPVVVNGVVATASIYVAGVSMRVHDQIVTDTVKAESVVSDGPGFLVIHADNAGAPGPVIGFAPVVDGTNANIEVTVDPAGVTPVLFPMLHKDDGVAGTYEFGEVEGADTPQATAAGSPLFYAISAAPAIDYTGTLSGTTLTVNSALIDVPGFLVIHADNGGAPGPVLGFTPLVRGLTHNVVVELSAEGMTETVFPMLHKDDGVLGTYEFGEVEGADTPVAVGGTPVFGPLTPTMAE